MHPDRDQVRAAVITGAHVCNLPMQIYIQGSARGRPFRFKICNDFSWTFVRTLYGLKPQNMSIHPIGILIFKYFRLLEAF